MKHTTYLHVRETQRVMPPVMALRLTLVSSNYPCLEHLFIVSKVFEPYHNYRCLQGWCVRTYGFVALTVLFSTVYKFSLLLFTVNRIPLHAAFHYHRSDMTEMLLNWTKNCKSSTIILGFLLCILNAKASHIFSTKNIGVFEILTFEILTKRLLTTSLVLNNRTQIYKHNFFTVEILKQNTNCHFYGFSATYLRSFGGCSLGHTLNIRDLSSGTGRYFAVSTAMNS